VWLCVYIVCVYIVRMLETVPVMCVVVCVHCTLNIVRALKMARVGQNCIYMYEVRDCIFGDFSAKNTIRIHTVNIWFWPTLEMALLPVFLCERVGLWGWTVIKGCIHCVRLSSTL